MAHSFDLMLGSQCGPPFDGIETSCSLPAERFSPPLPPVWPRLEGDSQGLARKLKVGAEDSATFFFKSGADLHHLGFSCRHGLVRPDLIMASRHANGRLLLEERRKHHFVGSLVVGYNPCLRLGKAGELIEALEQEAAPHPHLSFDALRRWAEEQKKPAKKQSQRLHIRLHNQKSCPVNCHLDLEQEEVLGAIKTRLNPNQRLEWLTPLAAGQFIWIILDASQRAEHSGQGHRDAACMVIWLEASSGRPRASHVISHQGATASVIHRPGEEGTWPIELAVG
ncbi:hypothetical protein ACTL6U_20770 [Rhodovibrionaceae bacterium A322]